ncbi:MAG: tRNA (cytidine(34)-2'-O)-methyltransferase [Bulleidia sp.]|nr:tRNA (cytidine(34)-2'-O)-methyltransferase [Erysipelotrichaceae bacterium]MDY2781308.1 tRNA (cytidine(34)-2'-O)-methyltransferase [Bulleidia sp.]
MINVVLYEPEIPQNTGNIMRTCMAFHCRLHLIEPLGFSLDESHLRRAGMDYRDKIEMHRYENWSAFLKENEGDFYYVTRYGDKAPSHFDYTQCKGDIYLVFGKESTGIPKEILYDHLDRCIRIPMVKEARSLNLSNCVALCVYEVLDQLGYPDLCSTETIKGEDFLSSEVWREKK